MNPFGYHPIPKNTYKSKKHSTDFSPATRKAILERDQVCVRCGQRGQHIHHITFRSSHGPNLTGKRNGCLVCIVCHNFAHSGAEGRKWFENWRDTILDQEGEYLF